MENQNIDNLSDEDIINFYNDIIEAPELMIASKCSYGCYCMTGQIVSKLECAPCNQCSS